MSALRNARADEAALLADIQEQASVAPLSHIFPPDQYPYPQEAIRTRWEALRVLADNGRSRRFYERRSWYENGRTRVVPYPPNPLDVGYTHDFLD
jgi:hypothetical protein